MNTAKLSETAEERMTPSLEFDTSHPGIEAIHISIADSNHSGALRYLYKDTL